MSCKDIDNNIRSLCGVECKWAAQYELLGEIAIGASQYGVDKTIEMGKIVSLYSTL